MSAMPLHVIRELSLRREEDLSPTAVQEGDADLFVERQLRSFK
jgi:hypothetical protein